MNQLSQTNGLNWQRVDDVLLDMDGTLLDRRFDDFFFEEELPRRYAAKHGLELEAARERLFALYRSVEGELDWTDLNYWTRTLGIDVVAMTKEFDHMIDFLPDAEAFLCNLRMKRKRVHLVTNAHVDGVRIKVARTGLDRHVDGIVTAFDVGYLKMRMEYWPACRRLIGFDPARTLYIDDDEACVSAAHRFGIGHVYHRSKSNSQLPPRPSTRYPSIENLQDLWKS
ncbi:MAG: HAD hydrolase-like protein [Nitrospiraceae bacterium]|nr:HAD hydrolase-like protein [Nitrospiraceae bacterium]